MQHLILDMLVCRANGGTMRTAEERHPNRNSLLCRPYFGFTGARSVEKRQIMDGRHKHASHHGINSSGSS